MIKNSLENDMITKCRGPGFTTKKRMLYYPKKNREPNALCSFERLRSLILINSFGFFESSHFDQIGPADRFILVGQTANP